MDLTKVNLGCGDRWMADCVNVDIAELTPPDGIAFLRADLRERWPFPDGEVDLFLAQDIIEHLPDKIHTINEAFRCLRPGGKLYIEVPTTDGPGAFQDPTHVSFWNRNSFKYFEAGNPYRDRFARSYGIEANFKVFKERGQHTVDGPKLTIVLEAVK